jgi:hypothetical protein
MGLTVNERYAIIRELAPRYQTARKRERSTILDEFVRLTGLVRPYASYVLKNYGVHKSVVVKGQRIVVVVGKRTATTLHRKRPRRYDNAVVEALERLWAFSNGLCGKRLAVFIRQTVPILERYGELTLHDAVRANVLAISPATIDRLLAPAKARSRLKGRSGTKPGTLLKHHIPIRTFAEWDDAVPGFVEIDLVAHDGGIAYGDYAQTLDVTDIATGWTETRAVRNKAQCHVFAALQDVRSSLPFPLLGIDSDNGSEFINNELWRYCEQQHITFTRSRPYRKNDNCFVEQKNYSVVRTTVGYYRYDQAEQLELLGRLYQHLRLFTNFFQPSMKLREKTRVGSKVARRYDQPVTPYHRVINHPAISDDSKDQLTALYGRLNPAHLVRSLAHLQHELFESALHAPKLMSVPHGYPAEDHPWRHQTLRARSKPAPSPVVSQPFLAHHPSEVSP